MVLVNSKTKQPTDAQGKVFPVLRPISSQKVTSGTSSAKFTENAVVQIVFIDDGGYLKITKDNTDIATDSDARIPAETLYFTHVNENEYITILGATANITIIE